MESMKIKTHIGNDKILKVELSDEFANEELEIVIVFQPVIEKSSMSKFLGILSDSESGELQQVIKDEFEQVDTNEL
ncbi:MAG: hypothetical protein H9536_15780 [Aphanizomenon flos-aquae Clear-A1]|jgi:hypothetical protein|nr:hypothetical protein [Aphanizomenon flos-aquae Clear-A1]QSV67170.1 MAG: hypothetical protein HEQ12_09615 [Aphanizomenon flos-aquae DEX188]